MLEWWQAVLANVTIFASSCLSFFLLLSVWRAQREDEWKLISAVSLVRVIRSILINAKSLIYFIFSFCEVPRLVSLLQTSPGEHVSLCPVRLVSKAFMWNIPYNIYEVQPPYRQRYSQFSSEIFDLKSQCSTEASCSWSRNNVASFHHAVLCWKSPVHPFSDSAISVWLAVGDPWASKIHWSSANNLSSTQTNDYNNICPPHLSKPIHECTVCCWHDGKCLLSSEYLCAVAPSNTTAAHSLQLF